MCPDAKVAVIGIDGATWNLLDDLLETKQLPNIDELVSSGIRSNLRSTDPPSTFPAWKAYSTGTNPGKLGVSSFVEVDLESRKFDLVSGTDFHGHDIWDYLSTAGIKCGVVNMPGTFPPSPENPDNCFMVSGPFSDDTGFTNPPELEQELADSGYRIKPPEVSKVGFKNNPKKTEKTAKELFTSRIDVAEQFVEEGVEFLHVTLFVIDAFQHFEWGEPVVERLWRHIDAEIGRLLDTLDDDWNIILMSDHGFTPLDANVGLPLWLEQNSYFKMDDHWMDILADVGVTRENVYALAEKLRLLPVLERLPASLLRQVIHRIPNEDNTTVTTERANAIDWENSSVIPFGRRLYLNNPDVDVDELVTKLEKITDPETGTRVIDEVCDAREIYDGDHLDALPDLVIRETEGYRMLSLSREPPVVNHELGNDWIAAHSRHGIFAATGPNIGSTVPESLHITELVPTILRLFGIEPPSNLDYEPRMSILMDYPETTTESTLNGDTTRSEAANDDALDRLADLGYLE